MGVATHVRRTRWAPRLVPVCAPTGTS